MEEKYYNNKNKHNSTTGMTNFMMTFCDSGIFNECSISPFPTEILEKY